MSGALEGRVIAVAGAGGSLGPYVVDRLAAEGATVAVSDISADKLEPLRERAGLDEEHFDAQVADLMDEDGAKGWCEAVVARFGRVDCLLHLVGGWRGGQGIVESPLSDYDFLHGLLVRTVQTSTRAFHDALVASGRGRFALIGQVGASRPTATNAAYNTAKAAAETWTLALADSFRRAAGGATANVVVINALVTDEMRAANPDKDYGNFTDADDVAAALAFLCSDAGAQMNGQRLALHG